jgi:hypothetical protein
MQEIKRGSCDEPPKEVDDQSSMIKGDLLHWASTLATYACPVFGDLPVKAIDVGLVMKAVELIRATKTETASRLRRRISLRRLAATPATQLLSRLLVH